MSKYAVMVDENEMVNDPHGTLLKLQNMTEEEVMMKIMHISFAQRVIFTDHPQSLFVPAILKEMTQASEMSRMWLQQKSN